MAQGEAPPKRAARPGPNERCPCGSNEKYKRCCRDRDEAESNVGAEARAAKRIRPGNLSPQRLVPGSIPRPEYAESGRPARERRDASEVKTPDEIERMRRACRAAAEVLIVTGAAVRPGITTDALDAIGHAACVERGGYPSPLNYRGFPKSICTSINEVICHGIPDDRPLEEGDIVNVDVTIYLDGMHGDCSATFAVGAIDAESRSVMKVAEECMYAGIEAARPGRPVRDIGRAIEKLATKHGMGSVRAFCGHGIGAQFHTALQISHYDDAGATTIMRPGMTFTVEPMITLGSWRHVTWPDGWTAVTADGRRTAQYEHTVLVTDTGVELLTVAPGFVAPPILPATP
jgi:methionyl aminopeptidase